MSRIHIVILRYIISSRYFSQALNTSRRSKRTLVEESLNVVTNERLLFHNENWSIEEYMKKKTPKCGLIDENALYKVESSSIDSKVRNGKIGNNKRFNPLFESIENDNESRIVLALNSTFIQNNPNSYSESTFDKPTNVDDTIESLNELPTKYESKTNKIICKEKEKAYFDINRSLHTKIIQQASHKKLITIKHIEEMLLYAKKAEKETANRPIIKIQRSIIDSTLMDDEGKCETIHDQDEMIGYINKNVHEIKKVLEKESVETDYKSRTILTVNSEPINWS